MKKHFKDEKLKRAMIAFKCEKVNDIAMLFNITPQNLNGYIDRNTFIDLIEGEASKRNINIDWIKTGQGSMTAGQAAGLKVADSMPSYGTLHPHPLNDKNDEDLVEKTKDILSSETIYRSALRSNIEAFHHALSCEVEIDRLNNRVATLESQMKSLQDRLRSASGE
jgi:hypothetical protein